MSDEGEPLASDDGASPPPVGSPGDLTLPPPPSRRSGGIVRRSLAVARANWATGTLAALLVILPVGLLEAFLDRSALEATATFSAEVGVTGGGILGAVRGLVLTPWALAAVFLVLIGRTSHAGEAIGAALRRLPHVVGAGLLAAVLCLLPFVPAVVAFFAGGGPEVMADVAVDGQVVFLGGPPPGLMLALALVLLAVLPATWLGLSLALTVPLAAADGMSPIAALRGSWRRMSGQRLRLLGGWLALVVPSMFVFGLVTLPFGLLVLAMGPEGGWVLAGIVDSVLTAFLTVLVCGVYAIVRADSAPGEDPPPDDPEAMWVSAGAPEPTT